MVRAARAHSALQNPRTLCTVKPDLFSRAATCVPMSRQGYEKRKGMVGAPRAKKARLPRVGTERSGISGAVAAVCSTEEASPSGTMELVLGTVSSDDEAEDKELQKQAAALTKAARKSVREAAVDVRKAEAALRHEQRRVEEREKRWWAAERRDAPPPAYLQLERAYKSQVKDLQARLQLSEARRREAEAKAELGECMLIEKDLELTRVCA